MSKSEILEQGSEPSAEEKTLLDRELAAYRANPNVGSSWTEVEDRLRQSCPVAADVSPL